MLCMQSKLGLLELTAQLVDLQGQNIYTIMFSVEEMQISSHSS